MIVACTKPLTKGYNGINVYNHKHNITTTTNCIYMRELGPFEFSPSCFAYGPRQANLVLIAYAYGPRQANLVLIAYASSEGSGEPAHPRSLARTFAARSYKQWIKRNLQTESHIPGPSECLGMRSWNLSWRNARRHKFAWRGSYIVW